MTDGQFIEFQRGPCRPVTWEHRHIYISPKQMGAGGGTEADSCQDFGSFQKVFPLSLCPPHRWHHRPPCPFQSSSWPPAPSLLSSSNMAPSVTETGWALRRPPSGHSLRLPFRIPPFPSSARGHRRLTCKPTKASVLESAICRKATEREFSVHGGI